MKFKKLTTIFLFIMLAAVLSSCTTGAVMASSWPGISTNGDTVYVSYKSDVLALNAKSGTQIWQFPAEPSNRQLFYAAPAVSDEFVAVGGYDNVFYTLNPETGSLIWSFTDSKERYIGSSTITADKILVPAVDDNLYVLDYDGNLIWSFRAEDGLWSQPVVDDNLVFQSSMDHHMYALNLEDGSLAWKSDLGGALVATPLYVDGVLYAGTLGNDMVAVDAATGTELWRFNASSAIWGTPVLHEGTLFFGDMGGTFYAVNAETGKETWMSEGSAAVLGSPALMPDGIAFSTEDGSLKAFSFTGENLWNLIIDGKLYSGPVVASDYLIVPVTNGENLLVAVDFSGSQRWVFTPAN